MSDLASAFAGSCCSLEALQCGLTQQGRPSVSRQQLAHFKTQTQ